MRLNSSSLIEGIAGVGVGGVASARHAVRGGDDLLGARGGDAGGISATEVVHDDGVGPVGLDGGVGVVHALVAGNRAVAANVESGGLVVAHPILSSVGAVDVEGTEVDVGIGGVGAANPRGTGDGAALVEGDELVEVVEISEHLRNYSSQTADTNVFFY